MAEQSESNYFSNLTWLQGKAAFCENIDQLAFHIVNHTIKIAPYAQALLWTEGTFGIKIIAVSGVSVINHTSPYIALLEKKIIPKILKENPSVTKFNTEIYADDFSEYAGYIFPWCLSLPFYSYDVGKNEKNIVHKVKSGLILLSKQDWGDVELEKLTNIVEYYKYLWDLFLKQSNYNIDRLRQLRKIKYAILAVVLVILIYPLKDSILVPAEIAPMEPSVISPSLSGMISEIYVKPNDTVKKGQKLFKLDTISLENKYKQALENLLVAQEKFRKAYQHSYSDPDSKSELKVLETQIQIADDEVKYNKSLLERAIIRADFAGTVIFSDPKNWLGRPVEIGERVMLLADDNKKQLDIFIHVDDLIELPNNAQVVFYPNPRPLDTISGEIRFISKQAELQPDNSLAYYTVGNIDMKEAAKYQFGIKGTAKVYGYRVVLAYYLFRRPYSWLRRSLGV